MDFKVKKGEKFLCIGDSITDCGRRDVAAPLGGGYVKVFNDLILGAFPERELQVINKGISGNTVPDLRMRWEDDMVFHKPDWMSVLIGINDLHRSLGGEEAFKPEKYAENYRYILKQAKERTGCRMILLEPFYISNDRTEWRGRVLEYLEKYREIVWQLGDEFKATVVKLHDAFQNNLKYCDADTFCGEPVHPNLAGHTVIAFHLFKSLLI